MWSSPLDSINLPMPSGRSACSGPCSMNPRRTALVKIKIKNAMNTEILQRQFHILHLEDNDDDHLLVAETLRADGLKCDLILARSKIEFTESLRQSIYDLIISDYSLPSYDGLSALAAAREQHSEVPFIFFSGTIGE